MNIILKRCYRLTSVKGYFINSEGKRCFIRSFRPRAHFTWIFFAVSPFIRGYNREHTQVNRRQAWREYDPRCLFSTERHYVQKLQEKLFVMNHLSNFSPSPSHSVRQMKAATVSNVFCTPVSSRSGPNYLVSSG